MSRAIFLDYLKEARAANPAPKPSLAVVQKEGVKSWNALTLVERTLFFTRLDALTDACNVRDWREDQAIAADAAAITAENLLVKDWADILYTAESAVRAWKRLDNPPGWSPLRPAQDAGVQQRVVNAFTELGWFTLGRANIVFMVLQRYCTDQAIVERAKVAPFGANADPRQRVADFPPVPQRPLVAPGNPPDDGRFKMFESTLSSKREAALKADRRSLFRDGALPDVRPFTGNAVNQWEGAWMMGSGGLSTTGLFLRYDLANFIDHRTMAKDTRMSRQQWSSAEFIDGNVRDARGRMPLETACHAAMATVRSRSSSGLPAPAAPQRLVPNLYSCTVSDPTRTYSLYMEYCPFGDLAGMIRRYTEADEYIPEPFLWYVFQTLAEAGIAMERGSQSLIASVRRWPADRYGKVDWEIVHRDLKPANVFLATNATQFSDYPTPMLGDFGLAVKILDDDQLNPSMFLDSYGTSGFIAPEMRGYVDRATGEPLERWPLGSATNLWGIGMIMYCLIARDSVPTQKEWLGDAALDVIDMRNAGVPGAYSNDLCDLVEECLAARPNERGNFQDLIRDIDILLDEALGAANRAQGMRNGSADPAVQPNLRLRHMPADAYALGLSRQVVPLAPP
ncbi:hypothetical protein LTR08_005744 [Meristemomyces frigidus]|nr:hypothetical protein LTR08_005744 [Meristemomyces frigidus]